MIPHLWIDLNEEISWLRVCESAEKINTMYGKQVINSDSLFEEQALVKKHMSERCKEKGWQNASLEQKWVEMFKEFEKKRIQVSNFQKLVEFIFCLPGTSAPVERIFSIVKSMWSESRNRMLEQNVKAVITCKINTDGPALTFTRM